MIETFERKTVTTTSADASPYVTTSTTNSYYSNLLDNVLYAIFGIIEFLLIFRLILKLFRANNVDIAAVFYSLSQPFVSPFQSIIVSNPQITGIYIEWGTVIAIIFYMILFAGIKLLINLFTNKTI